jgi:hypothetical protein
MNYELCKLLKDAGFPQETKAIGDEYFQQMGHPRMGIPHQWAVFTVIDPTINHPSLEKTMVKIPTLSELIEKCVEEIWTLRQDGKGRWVAKTHGLQEQYVPYSPTPEEAVARLWLALNKK